MKYLSFVVLFVALACSSAIAQAPSCPINDSYEIYPLSTDSFFVAWQAGEEDIFPLGFPDCTLRTKYCYRTVTSFPCDTPSNCITYQRYVYSVQILGTCGALTEMLARNLATEFIWSKLMPGDTLPPCEYGIVANMKGIMPACWLRTGDFPNYTYTHCTNDAECYTFCKLCQDGDVTVHFDCVYEVSEEPGCLNGIPGVGCYYMDCPSDPDP